MKYEEFERIYQEYYLKILTFIHKRVPDLYEGRTDWRCISVFLQKYGQL